MAMGFYEKLLIGFLLFSVFVVGGVMMIQDLDTNYDSVNMSDADDEFTDVYFTMDSMNTLAIDAKNKSLDSDVSDTESWESMTKGSYSAVRLIPNTFSLYHGIVRGIMGTMGVQCNVEGIDDSPSCVFVDAAFIAFVIIIAFSVIYMIFRFKP